MGVKVEADTSEVKRALDDFRARLADLSPVLEPQAELLETLIQRSFKRQEAPDGTPWLPLSAATLGKRRKGKGKRPHALPLQDTRTLFKSVKAQAEESAIAFGFVNRVPAGGREGTATYGYVHQFGTDSAGRSRDIKIPARPFLPVLPDGTPFFESGPAKRWFDRFRRAVVKYITGGKVG